MTTTLARDVRFLKSYAIISTTVGIILALNAFRQSANPVKFDEIDVERINIVEADGKLRMVISNQARQHPGIVNGKAIPRDGPRPPGIIFFNHLGDEMGGLIFGENGGIGHFGSLTFDKVRGDQTIGFRHFEGENGAYSTGLEMWQQPNVPGDVLQAKYRDVRAIADTAARNRAIQALRDADELTAQRLFLGKGRDNTVLLVLSDLKGRPRLRISVRGDGTPAIEVLDETGTARNVLVGR
jgi:hypothetical protein